jgi:putative ABC transport system substrate-binding protein
MRESGWTENGNIIYERAYADDDESRLPALAESLIKRNVDLIFTGNLAPTLAAHAKTRSIPIVFASVSGPVERGLARSLAHPGGNATGIANIGWELGGKRLQLLKQALPKASRIGLLLNPNLDNGIREQKLVEQAAATLRVKIIPVMAKNIGEIESVFALLVKNRAEALLVANQALFIGGGRKHVLAFAAKYRIPVIGPAIEFTEDSGLMSYGVNIIDSIRRAAQLADKILRGAKPADIPIELPMRFEFAVNQLTAKTLGITFPGETMLQATKVIE